MHVGIRDIETGSGAMAEDDDDPSDNAATEQAILADDEDDYVSRPKTIMRKPNARKVSLDATEEEDVLEVEVCRGR